jgi:hypothetical protein
VEIRARAVGAAEVNGLGIAFRVPSSEHGDGGLNIGPYRSFLFMAAGIWWRPPLV